VILREREREREREGGRTHVDNETFPKKLHIGNVYFDIPPSAATFQFSMEVTYFSD